MNQRNNNFFSLLRNRFFIALALAMIISCNYSNNKKDNSTSINSIDSNLGKVKTWDSLNLTQFSSIPDTIDGCGDYYLFDTSDLHSNDYIFLSRMREVAIIILDGDTVYLKIDTSSSMETDDTISDVYIGKDSLKVLLKVKKFKEFEEGAFYKGELIIQYKSKKRIFKIHGQTGC